MTIDTTRRAAPAIEVSCTHCGATGELFNIGVAWHRGAIEKCSYFSAAAGPANLTTCLHMQEALDAVWRSKPDQGS
jgi:hypothetical protein